MGAARWDRKERKAEADCAQGIDELLTDLESRLADPLAPRFNKRFLSELGRLTAVIREACRRQMLFRPKGGREIDQMKRDSANAVFYLMEKAHRPISGSAETTFPVVTMLLFEAVTGKPEANVKRACEYVLRRRRDC
jgi:hypothetical protein